MINSFINTSEHILTNILYNKKSVYKINYGSSSIQGYRDHMEDYKRVVRLNIPNIKTCYILILCDGHAGHKCSHFIIQILPKLFEQKLKELPPNYSNNLIEQNITSIFKNIDVLFKQINDNSGSTCVCTFFIFVSIAVK